MRLNDSQESDRGDELTKEYDLQIIVIRHGPKDGLSGSLTEQGKLSTKKFFKSGYTKNVRDTTVSRKVISSPVHRALQTAEIYEAVVQEDHGARSALIEQDERLSESDVIEFVNRLPQHHKEDWFRYWYAQNGKRVARDFAAWLMEKIISHQGSGGNLQIHAFSHGPTMAAFILSVEDILGISILSSFEKTNDRLAMDKLFADQNSDFNYLSLIDFHGSSKNPLFISITIGKKDILIPLSIIAQIAEEG